MTMEKTLRYLIIGGIFLLPFIPFMVTNSLFFPFITGKNFAFRILTEIIFGLWIILMLRNVLYRPSRSFILIAFTALVGIVALADLFGENPFKSFWSNFERMEGLVGLLHFFALFLVAGTVINTRKLWWWLANVSVGASIIMGIYGSLQLSGKLTINQGGVRVDGTFGNAAYLAVYMLFHIFITAVLLLRWRGPSLMRYLYGAVLLLDIVILFYTATRGAIFGFVGGMLLAAILFLMFGREYPRLRKGALGLLVGIVIIIAGLFVARDIPAVRDNPIFGRITNISYGELEPRFTIWNMAYQGFKEHPLLGWGQENFNLVFNKYYNPDPLYRGEPWFDRAHNIFFDWLVAGGALGLLAYLSIFLATLYYLWRREGRVHFSVAERSLITGLLAAYFFHNLFVFDNVMSYVLFMVLLAYIYNETRSGLKEGSVLARPLDSALINRLATPLVVVFIVAAVYFINIPGIKAGTALIDALSTSDSATRLGHFKQAVSSDGLGSQEVTEQLIQAAIVSARSTISLEQKQAIFTLAESEMKEEIERAPEDARLYVFLASLYDQYGEHEQAGRELEHALMLSPQKERIHYQLGFNYLNQGEYEKARDTFQYTFELTPESRDARLYYAAMLLYTGERGKAEELLKPIKERLSANGIPVINDDILLNAYAVVGDYESVLAIWQYRVEETPRDPRMHLGLAATYVQIGQDEAAIREIERAVELEPALKVQGEQFIEEIRAGRGKNLLQ